MWFTDTMTDLETMPVERVDVDTDETTETGEPTAAHIVKTKRGENAAAVVLEARVMGTPVEALCGFVWVVMVCPWWGNGCVPKTCSGARRRYPAGRASSTSAQR